MKRFFFVQKDSNVVVMLLAENYEDAKKVLFGTVLDHTNFVVEDENGEEDDETESTALSSFLENADVPQ